MTNQRLAAVIGGFGLLVIASGLIRYLSTPAGKNGLYFGLFAGGIALVGAVFAGVSLRLLGKVFGLAAIALVVLWFGYDLYRDLTRQFLIGPDEIRKTILIVAGLVATSLILRPGSLRPALPK